MVLMCMTAVLSCTKTPELSHTPDSVSLSINNRAVVYVGKAIHGPDSLKVMYYDSAIELLDIAILRDSLYVDAYSQKANVLKRKGLLDESFAVLDQALAVNPNFAMLLMMQGFILEKKGEMNLANSK